MKCKPMNPVRLAVFLCLFFPSQLALAKLSVQESPLKVDGTKEEAIKSEIESSKVKNGVVSFSTSNDVVIVKITSEKGIGEAELRRSNLTWPKKIRFQVHLKGLELFEIQSGKRTIRLAVSSSGEPTSSVSIEEKGKEKVLLVEDPLFIKVHLVADEKKIPLDGHFEFQLPEAIFSNEVDTIKTRWIDFYRN